jgi:hypothetical protein
MKRRWKSLIGKLTGRDRLAEFRDGAEPVDIRKLISPLRYDVLVRKQFFELLADDEKLCINDFDRFVEKAKRSPYFDWFEKIYCFRFHPELVRDCAKRRSAFRERVRKSADLFYNFRKAGFLKSHRITLRSGRKILPSDSGKSVPSQLFVGDGCHRIALLLMNGTGRLDASQYRIKIEPRYTPLDNTILLLPGLRLPESEYAAFISWAFGDVEYYSLPSLRDAVKQHCPQRMDELSSITEQDIQFLNGGKADKKRRVERSTQ